MPELILDLVLVGSGLAFLGASALYAHLCERL